MQGRPLVKAHEERGAVGDEMLLTVDGSVAIITFNRPDKMNALTGTMLYRDLPAMVDCVAENREIRAVVLTGAGRAFCAGADVGAVLAPLVEGGGSGASAVPSPEPWAPRFTGIACLRNIGKPTIAAVNGAAVGAGLSLALACDIRIAADTARFGAGFIRRGQVPDNGASFFLPRLVGTAKALELLYTGDIIDAREAERIGLVNRVVGADDLIKVTLDLASRIAKGPPIALALTKRLVYQWLEQDLVPQLEYEAYNLKLCRETEDYREGVRAFQEKREPEFKGR